ncbi:MAG: hypothetical protein FWF95_01620 [Syntrophorhabdaceae bacterium]|nr:hypothetical protein [Syntrophorhabdaceae bacterium]
MIRRMAGAAGVLVFALLLPSVACALMYININAPGGKRMPLAISDFVVVSGPPEFSREIPKIIESDLGMTDLFELIPADVQLEKIIPAHFSGRRLDFGSWKMIGADSVVIGKVESRGDQVSVEMLIFDVTQGVFITGKRYSADPKQITRLGHRLANDIVLAFTGIKGVFGTDIAFTARNGRAKEVFLVGMDGRNLRRVTSNRSFNLFPRWSPDGNWLSFTSFRTGVPIIYLRNLWTGVEKEIVRNGGTKAPGSFSPDGNWLYYSVSFSGNSDILRNRVVGGETEKVATGWGLEVSPSVSPDGKRLAFVSDRSGSPQIYVKEIGTSEERRISQSGRYATSPSWSPTGSRIAYTMRAGGRFAIYVVNPDGSDNRLVVSAPDADCEDPSFSPDGRQLVYTFRKKGYSGLKIVSLDGRRERTLISGMEDAGSPAWSPAR